MNLEYTKIRDRHTSPCLKGINLIQNSLWKCKIKFDDAVIVIQKIQE